MPQPPASATDSFADVLGVRRGATAVHAAQERARVHERRVGALGEAVAERLRVAEYLRYFPHALSDGECRGALSRAHEHLQRELPALPAQYAASAEALHTELLDIFGEVDRNAPTYDLLTIARFACLADIMADTITGHTHWFLSAPWDRATALPGFPCPRRQALP